MYHVIWNFSLSYCNLTTYSILLYADEILLVAPSFTSLQQLLHLCEQELDWVDMSLDVKRAGFQTVI